MAEDDLLLRVQGVNKSFPGVKALIDVDFDLRVGEVHALLGENGAGKSTLVKILTGIHAKDSGTILVNGHEVQLRSNTEATEAGIAAIFQEFALVPHLDVGTNIFLGRIPARFGFMADKRDIYAKSQAILDLLGTNIDARTVVAELGVGKRQLVEIAKALSMDAKILIMDEPTSALSAEESSHLFSIIADLKTRGIGIVYISHKLEEIHGICDRISVMRDGRNVGTHPAAALTLDRVIQLMVGREITQQYYKGKVSMGGVVMEVRGLSDNTFLRDISFDVRKGEILGLAGLVGAGRTETARCLFGIDPMAKGDIFLDGKRIDVHSPEQAVANGIVMLSEDRKSTGLFLSQPVMFNVTIAAINAENTSRDYFRLGWVLKRNVQVERAREYAEKLRVKTPSINQTMSNLSGGNQQKTILAKWLLVNPRVVIFDEPTRGIDVGAKQEIYHLMERLLSAGMAIVMISSELPEILAISDRIAVISKGRVTGIMERSEATQEKIMALSVH